MKMYLVTIPGAEPRNVIAPSADTAIREAAQQLGYCGIPAGTECQRVTTPKSFRDKRAHPWGAWQPGSLESDSKDKPLRVDLPRTVNQRNRAV